MRVRCIWGRGVGGFFDKFRLLPGPPSPLLSSLLVFFSFAFTSVCLFAFHLIHVFLSHLSYIHTCMHLLTHHHFHLFVYICTIHIIPISFSILSHLIQFHSINMHVHTTSQSPRAQSLILSSFLRCIAPSHRPPLASPRLPASPPPPFSLPSSLLHITPFLPRSPS